MSRELKFPVGVNSVDRAVAIDQNEIKYTNPIKKHGKPNIREDDR